MTISILTGVSLAFLTQWLLWTTIGGISSLGCSRRRREIDWKSSWKEYTTRRGEDRIVPASVDIADAFARYSDDENEYRHVQLPKEMIKKIPKDYFDPSKGTLKLLWEEEWRGLGITQVRKTTEERQHLKPQLIARLIEFRMGALRSS